MSYRTRIDIVVATASHTHVLRLIDSLTEHLVGFDLKVHILLFGQQQGFKAALPVGVDVFHHQVDYADIATNRNRCQSYLQKQMRQRNSMGLVLDDDLVWTLSASDIRMLLQHLHSVGADMAFLGLAGDAPIPAEYTRAAPTLDMLLAIAQQSPQTLTVELKKYYQGIQVDDASAPEHWHHDYYSYNLTNFCNAPVDLKCVNWSELLHRLCLGKQTTRAVKQVTDIQPATGRERGGATLVLNPQVLDIPNTSIVLKGWTSRRSDMLMAMAAHHAGFRLFVTPAALRHEREVCFDSFSAHKLLGDLLGYALVEARQQLFDRVVFYQHLHRRTTRTLWLVEQTLSQLDLLYAWLVQQQLNCAEVDASVKKLQAYNYQLIQQLRAFFVEVERGAIVDQSNITHAQSAITQ